MIVAAAERSDLSRAQLDFLLGLARETQNVSGDIVEIGSWKCGTSIALAIANPTKTVYAFDLFGGLPYGEGRGFENFGNTDWEEIQATTAPHANLKLIRGMHELTVPEFASWRNAPLSLIFMDSDFYSSHRVSLAYLSPLLSIGGMIVFHDWTFADVQQAVNEVLDLKDFDTFTALNMGVLRRK